MSGSAAPIWAADPFPLYQQARKPRTDDRRAAVRGFVLYLKKERVYGILALDTGWKVGDMMQEEKRKPDFDMKKTCSASAIFG